MKNNGLELDECIIVSNEGFDEKDLQNMVMEVNSTQVSPEERLSDSVYSYDSKEHKLSLATNDKTHEESHEHDLKSPKIAWVSKKNFN